MRRRIDFWKIKNSKFHNTYCLLRITVENFLDLVSLSIKTSIQIKVLEWKYGWSKNIIERLARVIYSKVQRTIRGPPWSCNQDSIFIQPFRILIIWLQLQRDQSKCTLDMLQMLNGSYNEFSLSSKTTSSICLLSNHIRSTTQK